MLRGKYEVFSDKHSKWTKLYVWFGDGWRGLALTC